MHKYVEGAGLAKRPFRHHWGGGVNHTIRHGDLAPEVESVTLFEAVVCKRFGGDIRPIRVLDHEKGWATALCKT